LSADAPLLRALEQGRRIGLLGAGPVEDQVRHARRFGGFVPQDCRVADLGSGAGLPGLVLAHDRDDLQVVLVERSQSRADHLRRCVGAMGLGSRVEVVEQAAEQLGRDPATRGTFDAVTARSFGPPGVVAECAVGLLASRGRLLVSEPPEGTGQRWVPLGDTPLNLSVHQVHEHPDGTLVEIRPTGPPPATYPRPPGVPARRPLF
jgi:16S rRNA (guanine527-N7)-methyltransferase